MNNTATRKEQYQIINHATCQIATLNFMMLSCGSEGQRHLRGEEYDCLQYQGEIQPSDYP